MVEKFIHLQLVKKLHVLQEVESSLPYSQSLQLEYILSQLNVLDIIIILL